MASHIVKNALEYYDKNREKYDSFIKKIDRYGTFSVADENLHNEIEFYDKDNKIIHTSPYEMIGIYLHNSSTWTWAWSVPKFKSIQTFIIGKIFNYGRGLSVNELFLRTALLLSKYQISSKAQIDIHLAIASYLAKKPFVMGLVEKKLTDDETERSGYFPFIELNPNDSLDTLEKDAVIHFVYILDPPPID